jgi:hypothetical protein
METNNQNSRDGNRSAAMPKQQQSGGAKYMDPKKEGKRPIYIKDLPRIHPAIPDAGV